MPNILDSENQHIYITSDEQTKEGDWFINLITKEILRCFKNSAVKSLGGKTTNNNEKWLDNNKCKKIILTTDQSLDGIQEIDDEFLEWFIKNPSCENVEVVKDRVFRLDEFNQREFYNQYKIIIPKEEQKQHLIDIMRGDEELGLYEQPKQTDEKGGPITFREGLEKSKYVMGIDPYDKQETLEELVKEFYSDENQLMERIAFKRGYTECEERMYSEEDMRKAFKDGSWVTSWSDMGIEMKYDTFEQWFEQFKKK